MHFVQQLFLDGLLTDPSAAMTGFAYDQAAILMDLGNRTTQVGQIRNLFHARVGKIAASDLGAAFQQVARGGGDSHFLPIVGGPAQPMADRPHRQRRIGDTATQHDASASGECLGDTLGAGVDVHRNGLLLGARRQPPFVTRRRFFQQVVAQHAGDFQRREATRQLMTQPLRGGPGISCAAVVMIGMPASMHSASMGSRKSNKREE